jgi:hypothetical protein
MKYTTAKPIVRKRLRATVFMLREIRSLGGPHPLFDGAPKKLRTELYVCDTEFEYAILPEKWHGVNTLL